MPVSDHSSSTTDIEPPRLGEPYLLTPGPLTTRYAVKEAMLCDWGSWDQNFIAMSKSIQSCLLGMLDDRNNDYVCVLMQGSGTFATEAMLGSLVPHDGKTLVLCNGAYGQRITRILAYLGRDHIVLDKGDYLPPRGEEVAAILNDDPSITQVVAVHCETSSGILNPLAEISAAVANAGRELLIDSMSAFGAIPVSVQALKFKALVSSANKCIEGVPGFGFVLVKRSALESARGQSHSLSLDLYEQWQYMEKTGQWRFTPPTHSLAAFREALRFHELEGGVKARGARYQANCETLVSGMRSLGFETLLNDQWLSPIIVTFFSPEDERFDFARFYTLMKERGFIIYPGKLTVADSFRIGCIGQLDSTVMASVVEAAGDCLRELGVVSARAPASAYAERERLTAQTT